MNPNESSTDLLPVCYVEYSSAGSYGYQFKYRSRATVFDDIIPMNEFGFVGTIPSFGSFIKYGSWHEQGI